MRSIRMPGTVCLVRISQFGLIVPLLVCAMIQPHYWLSYNQGGVTNYATVTYPTAVLYALAFALCTSFLLLAGRKLGRDRSESWIMYTLAGLFAFDWITAYGWDFSSNAWLDWSHVIADGSLFLTEAFIAGIVVWISRKWNDVLLSAGLGAGVATLIVTYTGFLHLLFLGEALTSVTFAILIVRYVKHRSVIR